MTDALSLYIHWPFCLAKCPYCDFNSHVREKIPQERFATALRNELAHDAARLGPRRLNAIFFGGGTPSLMAPETVAALIDDAERLFKPAPDLEITLEANPTSVESGRLAAFRDAGVNRVSLGIQSLREDALRLLGREHSASQAIKALETARNIFPRISFDLIYARPGQSPADWKDELSTALDLVADHLSLYQLTIEPGTKYEALHRRGEISLPDDETAAELYTLTGDVAATRGLMPYEVSNYAKPGCESRHNLTYWRYQDYLGIGPGAHGRMTYNSQLHATRRHRAPEPWADLVEKYGTGSREETLLSDEEKGREALLMGLRLTEGINAEKFEQRSGRALQECIDPDIFSACLEEDYLQYDGTTLRATSEGRLRLESLLARLVL
ncbi:coproporphyrinogen III oxidase [Neokomagataea thailandica NBRC 106555]|uniref:Heme chaperone HemW n=2 Tax=Neokomagataea TaxID=1223423 RepID=A0A4Y6V5B5_9PROT|nr:MULTISPECIES: radical SAM family heme chaperone HemW [Neokomagataea]QDH25123.1 coproporphyrinogen III oxidase [Neokomagataea tanensis]GBR52090.1 coproporphyrinogen III oxidase [Neokomagataea thailandica NBRC 106555]